MRYAQLVMGPAGSGKSTYCSVIMKHCQNSNRNIHVINLDPAAEHFDYEPMADVKNLIQLEDVMEDEKLNYGPNGGLIFCMEYLMQNTNWLEEELGVDQDDYILFDCPGQIELYTHMNVMKQFITTLQNLDFNVCGVFLLDSQFMVDASKFFSGVFATLSTMVNLEIPHINILSKLDLLNKRARKILDRYLEPDIDLLVEQDTGNTAWHKKHQKLSQAIGKLVDDYSLVKFMALDIENKDSIDNILYTIDNAIQYGEDLDVKVKDLDEFDEDPINNA